MTRALRKLYRIKKTKTKHGTLHLSNWGEISQLIIEMTSR